MATRTTARRIGFAVALVAIVGLAFEGLCALALLLLGTIHDLHYEPLPVDDLEPLQRFVLSLLIAGEHQHLTHDPELGWTIRPRGSTELYHANAQGLRGRVDYAPVKPPGRVRVETFGDSFTHGDDVSDGETWQAWLERLEPRFEILNFGVPSYGLDQAFLRYRREGPAFAPDIVVIGFLSENLHRTVNTFRPFYRPPTGVPLSKPRFTLESGELRKIDNPLPRLDDYQRLLDHPIPTLEALGAHDYYFQRMQSRAWIEWLPSSRLTTLVRTRFLADEIVRDGVYDPESEAFRVTLALFDAFVSRVEADGAAPIVLLYPTSTDLRRARAGEPPVYEPLRTRLAQRGYEVVDLLDAFQSIGRDHAVSELIRLHNTPLGNRIAAEHLRGVLTGLEAPGP